MIIKKLMDLIDILLIISYNYSYIKIKSKIKPTFCSDKKKINNYNCKGYLNCGLGAKRIIGFITFATVLAGCIWIIFG